MQSRVEDILLSIINGTSSSELPAPQSRTEVILKAILDGTDSSELPPPQSRNEALLMRVLDKINEGGGDITVESLSVTENGTTVAPEGTAYSPVSVNVQPTLQIKTATQNGTVTPDAGYDGLSSVVVKVSGGGGNRNAGIGPYTALIPYDKSNNGIAGIAANNTYNIVTDGYLPVESIGPTVIICVFANGISNVTVSGFTALYSNGLIKVFSGILTSETSLTATVNAWFTILEINDNYEPVVYNNLCASLEVGETVNTDYLKTSKAFKVCAALPAGYGMFLVTSTYDYTSESYRPTIWETLNRFIPYPEICLRRIDGDHMQTGSACFLKLNKTAYNQYFLRGSVNGKIEDDRLRNANTLTSISTVSNFKEVPTWDANLSTAYIQIQPKSA